MKAVDESKPPKMPPFLHAIISFLCVVLFLLGSIGLIILGFKIGGIVLLVFGGLGLFIGGFCLYIIFTFNDEFYYNKYNNFEKWKEEEKVRVIKRYDEYAINLAKYGQREKPVETVSTQKKISIKCPVCGSTNTKELSNLNRTASVATWGLASSKIGKQYECKSCGHKW